MIDVYKRQVFRLYRMNKMSRESRDSMAMRGFEETAEIVQNHGESYLELKLKEMTAHSRANGKVMAGRLKTLKLSLIHISSGVTTATSRGECWIYMPSYMDFQKQKQTGRFGRH